ncbi:MAG: hypothetical protein AMXMBFR84_08800 [Candidatus Hydrogenedentota bacterium]
MIRIANGQGFWGDSVDAPSELLRLQPDLDYLTLDYLAEVSMSIMASQRERNPQLGYARDFVDVVKSLAPHWQAGCKTRVISNGGGLDPVACAKACMAVLREAGLPHMRVGVVLGDDVLDLLRSHPDWNSFAHMESGEPLETILPRLVTANAYIGSSPIADALQLGADIVVTGRTADPCLAAACAMHHFHWDIGDYDRMAGALIAGHVLECGAQATGGISTHWLELADPAGIGFPVVEVESDGAFVVTKPEGTGGAVTLETVKEQLLYEMGDPGNFLTPDATVSILGLALEESGPNRIHVSGAKGRAPTDSYKVSATYRDGWRASGTLTVFGRDAAAKAKRCGEIVLERLRRSGYELERTLIECLGTGACAPGVLAEAECLETVLRLSVADSRKEAVERFSKELMPLVTSGPQGVTGYAGGRPKVSPVFGYWPCLVDKSLVAATARLVDA